MSVWAFACKVESSMNRWFDGTDQDVHPNDDLNFMHEKGVSDNVDTLDSYRRTWLKYVSQVHGGIGSMMFNVVQFNAFYRELSDYSDAVFMQDAVDIELSRAIVRVHDLIYPVEYFSRTYEAGRISEVSVSDDTFVNVNDSSGHAVDTAGVNDISTVELTRNIAPSVDDQVSFTEAFKASVGGKSIYDLVSMKESLAKDLEVGTGDEQKAGAIGTFVLNAIMINGESEEATISTVIGLTEDVQIILT